MIKPIRILQSALIVTMLAGCATPKGIIDQAPVVEDTRVDVSTLFARGIFNWWEADPLFAVKASNGGSFQVNVELIADGQPYDFKFADAYWTSATNCGLAQLSQIQQGREIQLYCGSDSQNIQFIPRKTGVYQFILHQSRNGALSFIVIEPSQ